jgi:hypothetical protein
MTQFGQGVFITDQLFLPRYIWFKMKFMLPQIQVKIQYFNEIRNLLKTLKILYNKNAAQIKHLAQLAKTLNEMKGLIGETLFESPQMESTGSIITNQDDEFMRNINEKYEGAGGSSVNNCI